MSAPIRVRVSEAMLAALEAVSGNTSAATRALIVLGLHAAGYNVAGLRREIALLLAEELDAPALAALEAIAGRRRTDVGQASYAHTVESEAPGDLFGTSADCRFISPGVEQMVAGDAEHITLAGAPQRRLDLARAIDAVCRHPGEGYLGGQDALDHCQGQLGLGRKLRVRRNMSRLHPCRIVRPGLGQIERSIDEGMAMA